MLGGSLVRHIGQLDSCRNFRGEERFSCNVVMLELDNLAFRSDGGVEHYAQKRSGGLIQEVGLIPACQISEGQCTLPAHGEPRVERVALVTHSECQLGRRAPCAG